MTIKCKCIGDFFIPMRAESANNREVKKGFVEKCRPLMPEPLTLVDYPIKASVVFYFRGECKCDIDNLAKALLDAMQGRIIKDDKYIKKLSLEIIDHSFMEGIAVTMRKL